MNAEEFLSQYLDAKSRLHRLNEERESIRDLMTHITPRYDSVSVRHDRNVNKIPDALGKLEELDKKYSEESRRAVELMEQIHDVIYMVPDGKQREILTMRYILGYQIKRIALEMKITDRTVCRLQRCAMEQAQSVLNELPTGRRFTSE